MFDSAIRIKLLERYISNLNLYKHNYGSLEFYQLSVCYNFFCCVFFQWNVFKPSI